MLFRLLVILFCIACLHTRCLANIDTLREEEGVGIQKYVAPSRATPGVKKSATNDDYERRQIFITSSNSIYQFALLAAEGFSGHSQFRTPIVEPVGTGMGFKQFCLVSGRESDILFSSRKMRPAEVAVCKENGINNIQAMQIGYDGIVFVTSKENPLTKLDQVSLFKALAKNVMTSSEKWEKNPYTKWSEIDASLPDIVISFYAPSLNTSSSDAVSELLLVSNCIHICCKRLPYNERYARCSEFRDDKHYIVGNDDARIVVQKLQTNKLAVGMITYNSYMENVHNIKSISIDGVEPNKQNIMNKKYNLVRPLWVYVKVDNIKSVMGLQEFMSFVASKEVIGTSGILTQKGLVPLS